MTTDGELIESVRNGTHKAKKPKGALKPDTRTIRALHCPPRIYVEKVERYEHHSRTSHDLYGCIDLLAFTRFSTIGLQVTGHTNHSSRVKKCLEADAMKLWLANCSRHLWVVSWQPKAGRFVDRVTAIGLEGDRLIEIWDEKDYLGGWFKRATEDQERRTR